MILAIKQPLPLGGKMVPANFQVENIYTFYESTGRIFAKAVASENQPRS